MRATPALLMCASLFGACTPGNTPADAGNGVAAFRGLLATPRQVAFTCVVPGCDTTLNVKVQSNVNRRVAIKRIVLSHENADYTLTADQSAPFILGAASDFAIAVKYTPVSAPTAEDLQVLVTYTDAAAGDGADRIEPGELAIPLVRRLVGAPELSATPGRLDFGVVPVGARKSMPVKVMNSGFGNISMAVDGYDAGGAEVSVTLPMASALVPDAGVTMPVAFAPTTELYLHGTLELLSKTPGVDPAFIALEGTSYSKPRLRVEPEESTIDLGPVKKGSLSQVTFKLANIGGQDLSITRISVTDPLGNVTAALANGDLTGLLKPLQRAGLVLTVDGKTAGVIAATLIIESNDPQRARLEVPIIGSVTEPKIQATPAMLSWGTLPMGWVVAKSVEVKNIGFGPLTVKAVSFVGGTPNVFAIRNLPPLPATLQRDQRGTFEVEFRAETAATFMGSVSIETDDPVNPFFEVKLTATGGSCGASCPIAHGTASCAGGTCSIGMCNAGWFDTNTSASDGCECQDVGADPGGFCSTGVDKGTLTDSGASTSFTGMLPVRDDVDYIKFFAEDQPQVFGENYDVRIRMQSSDANVQMCVYRYDTANAVGECYLNNETCTRDFRKNGSYGSEDGAMYYIKVFRTANAAPACTPYTIYMSNG